MASTDLQALLANLRPRSQASNVSRDLSRDPSSTFAPSSQIPSTPPPPFSPVPSTTMQENPTATPSAQHLLNLLNFGHSQMHPTNGSTVAPKENDQKAADLQTNRTPSSPNNPLLGLLQKSANGVVEGANGQRSSTKTTSFPSGATPQMADQHISATVADSMHVQQTRPIFTYTNPFETLKA